VSFSEEFIAISSPCSTLRLRMEPRRNSGDLQKVVTANAA
jgi:hypothetical protein